MTTNFFQVQQLLSQQSMIPHQLQSFIQQQAAITAEQQVTKLFS